MMKIILKITLLLFVIAGLFYAPDSNGNIGCAEYFTKNIEINGNRDLNLEPDIKLATYNLQDMVFNQGGFELKKSTDDLKKIASIIEQEDINFLVLEEIQSKMVLDQFNEQYLKNRYISVVVDGNDNTRKIGFLIEKDLPIKFDVQTFNHLKSYNKLDKAEMPIFSRDLPALLIRHTKASNTDPPSLIVMGTHFKSQRNYKTDIKSVARRKTQVDETARIINEYEKLYPDTPIIIAGDFNANIESGTEFKSLFKNNWLEDGLDLNTEKLKSIDRVTQTFHQHDGQNFFTQMDAILFNKKARDIHKKTYIYRYKDMNGKIKELPKSFQERSLNPSDHFPVITQIDLKEIFKDY